MFNLSVTIVLILLALGGFIIGFTHEKACLSLDFMGLRFVLLLV